MKSIREILLGRHRDAVPALDAIRERVVASESGFIEFVMSLRWHVAAMSAIWLVVAMLGTDNSGMAKAEVAGAPPPAGPMGGILAWREYAKDFDEADSPPQRQAPGSIPHACIDPRRESECNTIA